MEYLSIYKLFVLVYSIHVCEITCFECDIKAEVCKTSLVIDHQLTMTSLTSGKPVCALGGKLYESYNGTNGIDEVSINDVITTDGWKEKQLVIVANSSLSNTQIIVYEGQRLIIKVTNNLFSDTVTIHWHGLLQENTPWMDGVGFITQCPILQGQSFTYDFIANPVGSYWFHSHVGMQRITGLNGPLIIRQRNQPFRAVDAMEEHIMTVQDWNHDWGANQDFVANFKLTSVLINGRGRYYTNNSVNEAPLETFSVEQGKQYRFRVINVGAGYTFRVSIDNHTITLIASDGKYFDPVDAESFIFSPGERFDFIVTANQSIDNYWIRAVTLDNAHKAEAILRYNNAPLTDPVTSRKICTSVSSCIVMNCPFLYFPEQDYIACKYFAEMRRSGNDPAPSSNETDSVFKEFFLNFGFPGRNSTPASVNGIQFKLPTVSALTQPQEIDVTCDDAGCGEDRLCKCMHSISINQSEIVQLVLLNMGKGKGEAHPIHLHGYSFYVVKVGYATYNETTGDFISQNTDINCQGVGGPDQSFCNNATWSDPSWLGGNVPGMELKYAPRKDTLLIPSGSYAVIRIKAGNWGVWLMHCHIANHFQDGMGLVFNDSFALSSQNHPPSGFPQCRSFPSAYQTGNATVMNATTLPLVDVGGTVENDQYKVAFWVMFPVMLVAILLAMAYIVYLRRRSQGQINGPRPGMEMTEGSTAM
ncbi:uncharacterized protein LOC132558449 [Ylistrum balloti]|uniref:uncharacterized protein LOC132558449 n=1 Tax=Ylistrum balloti TaxID=509963 RepID=UPI002905DD0E|nr:uncharacterized protein LOC132558449 [Ylistrum balloti]